ncbi:hypothetical protein [Actinacidiphila oryziradicis]|uniref:Uncharacterized protein n=1 Tax=Actinacidiphila oryziradicis TaxID=2571141 RepID=A0A4U0SMB6_9ACTN|nr:hypothetical protein [Actinacidiphila oryziradicis]TKA11054.1 hypothetical protein FCI23_13965 [Actinacidiphila oryziradicis]
MVRLFHNSAPGRQQELVLREWEVLRDRLRRAASARVADAADIVRTAELLPGQGDGAARRDYVWALDAYQAAGKLLDEAADLPDLAAVVVLAERAVERLEMARARCEGRRMPAQLVRCFYNPLHGAARPVPVCTKRRRRPGPRQAAADRRPACEACRNAILAGQLPDVLPALLPVQEAKRRTVRVLVPYYSVPQQWSLWAATACGAYDEESPGLVLSGEHRRRASGREAVTGSSRGAVR